MMMMTSSCILKLLFRFNRFIFDVYCWRAVLLNSNRVAINFVVISCIASPLWSHNSQWGTPHESVFARLLLKEGTVVYLSLTWYGYIHIWYHWSFCRWISRSNHRSWSTVGIQTLDPHVIDNIIYGDRATLCISSIHWNSMGGQKLCYLCIGHFRVGRLNFLGSIFFRWILFLISRLFICSSDLLQFFKFQTFTFQRCHLIYASITFNLCQFLWEIKFCYLHSTLCPKFSTRLWFSVLVATLDLRWTHFLAFLYI